MTWWQIVLIVLAVVYVAIAVAVGVLLQSWKLGATWPLTLWWLTLGAPWR